MIACPSLPRTEPILVAGAGGFIGGWLVRHLLESGFETVRAVDEKPLDAWYQVFRDADNRVADLRGLEACTEVVDGIAYVYNLACDMGGMGFIELNKASCMLSVLTSTHLLCAAREARARRYFYASSACVYNVDRQRDARVRPLREEDAYPAMPEDGYGWEKLFSERMCRHFREDFGLETRVARYHNVYGPNGTYEGGREKAPAAICRKVITAKLSGNHEIEIWGDGEQTRSFTYVDDCIFGTRRLMESDVSEPINLGSSELVTINQLVDLVEEIAGIRVRRRYKLDAPKGVRGRNSDNTLIRERLGWEPSTPLAEDADVLITDVVLPTLSGPELVGRLGERNASLRVIFMTGYGADALDEQLAATHPILQKPFTAEQLSRALEQALSNSSRPPGASAATVS